MSSTEEEGTEDQSPHAYVAYENGSKEIVPISFIKGFPVTWSNEKGGGWDKNYLFRTFWSGNDTDSPEEMLKRCSQIPDQHQQSTEPGFYRASVVVVKGSRKELEEHLKKKRPSVGLAESKYKSFDDEKDKNSSRQPSSKSRVNDKSSKSKKKHSGINRVAQKENTADIRAQISKMLDAHSSQSAGTSVSASKKNSGSQNSVAKPSSRRKRQSSVLAIKRDDVSVSSDDLSLDVGDKRIKLDPDFTPTKFVQVTDELKILKNTERRISNLNLLLQEKLHTSEEKRIFLEDEVARLKLELAVCQQNKCSCQNKGSPFKLKEKKKQVVSAQKFNTDSGTPRDVKCKTLKMSSSPSLSKGASGGKKSPLAAGGSVGKKSPLGSGGKKQYHPESWTVISGPREHQFSLSSDTDDVKDNRELIKKKLWQDEKVVINAADYCEASYSDETELSGMNDKESPKSHSDSYSSTKKEDYLNKFSMSTNVRGLFETLSSGPNKDAMFCKDLATVTFGPELLAKSSIFGTAKGGRKKGDKEKTSKKPALDKVKLQAVRDALVKRVEKDIGQKVEDMDTHPRTSQQRFFEHIRGAQKRLRGLGFGEGTKENDVSKEILMMAD